MPQVSSHARPHPAWVLERASPAIVAQEAVWRIPRWLLWLLCAAYIGVGFVGRDPWKSADITALGFVQALARGESAWLRPMLQDVPAEPFTWLPYWLGALSMQLMPAAVPADMAARWPFVLLFMLAFLAVWYATYLLARHAHAQPLPFALGGEAQAVDYARTVADGSILAFMATLGLAQLGHEATPALARLAFVALWLYAWAAQHLRPLKARWIALIAACGLALSGAPFMAAGLGLLAALAQRLQDQRATVERSAHSTGVSGLWYAACGLLACTFALALSFSQHGWANSLHAWSQTLHGRSVGSSLRMLAWFFWPTGPLALVALYMWRRWWRSPHILQPAMQALAIIGCAAYWQASERNMLLAIPALAVLAAFYLPTMRRTIAAWIDWFALLFFSICGLIMWVVWLSLETGVPPQPARNVARLLPGYIHQHNLWGLLFAVIASACWFWLIRWRVGRDRSALWKSLALPAGGAVLCWLLLLTLWFPMLNSARSYTEFMARIRQQIPSDAPAHTCLYTHRLEPAQIAALRFYLPWRTYALAHVRKQPIPSQQVQCQWLVSSMAGAGNLPALLGEENWQLQNTLQRPSDKREFLLLYTRSGHAP